MVRDVIPNKHPLPINPFLFRHSSWLLSRACNAFNLSLFLLLLSIYYYLPIPIFLPVWWGIPLLIIMAMVPLTYFSMRPARGLIPMDEIWVDTADKLQRLAGRRFLMIEPPPLLYVTKSNIVARAWEEQGRGRIVLGWQTARSLQNDESALSAIVLHEMSHLKNRDFWPRQINRLFLVANFLLLIGLGAWFGLPFDERLLPLQGMILSLVFLLLLLWAHLHSEILAEIYADKRASLAVGSNVGLLYALRTMRPFNVTNRFGSFSPRETSLLGIGDIGSGRLLPFFFYGIIPHLSLLAVLIAFRLCSPDCTSSIPDWSNGLLGALFILTNGMTIILSCSDFAGLVINHGWRRILLAYIILASAMIMGSLLNDLFFPYQLISDYGLILLTYIVLPLPLLFLLLRSQQNGVPALLALKKHQQRLWIVGFWLPFFIIAIVFLNTTNPEIAVVVRYVINWNAVWVIFILIYVLLEALRFLPGPPVRRSWSLSSRQIVPDEQIELGRFLPISTQDKVSMLIVDYGILALSISILFNTINLEMIYWCLIVPVLAVLGHMVCSSGGRRSPGAWLLGITSRNRDNIAPTGWQSLSLIAAVLRSGSNFNANYWVRCDESRISHMVANLTGIILFLLSITFILYRLLEGLS